MKNQEFRTCPESGLQFHKPAETLMRLNAVLAVVALLSKRDRSREPLR